VHPPESLRAWAQPMVESTTASAEPFSRPTLAGAVHLAEGFVGSRFRLLSTECPRALRVAC
jgi:hypothetical protein